MEYNRDINQTEIDSSQSAYMTDQNSYKNVENIEVEYENDMGVVQEEIEVKPIRKSKRHYIWCCKCLQKKKIPWCCCYSKICTIERVSCNVFKLLLCHSITPSNLFNVESKKKKESSDTRSIVVAHGAAQKQIYQIQILLRRVSSTSI